MRSHEFILLCLVIDSLPQSPSLGSCLAARASKERDDIALSLAAKGAPLPTGDRRGAGKEFVSAKLADAGSWFPAAAEEEELPRSDEASEAPCSQGQAAVMAPSGVQ